MTLSCFAVNADWSWTTTRDSAQGAMQRQPTHTPARHAARADKRGS